MPLVSVVMTSYNHDKYVALAIESVLEQTFFDFELIIVDDASTDRSQEIIRKYQEKDSRIRFIFHETNQGISQTTNDAFRAARGQYIAYVQSDDLWLSEKLGKQLKILKKNRNLVVWSDAAVIDNLGNLTGQLFTEKYRAVEKQKSGDIFFELVNDNYICCQSMIFNRDVVDEIKFDPRLIYANDYKFALDLAKRHVFYFIDEPLVKYRIHEDNSIHKGRSAWEKDFFRINKYLLRDYGSDIPLITKAKLYNRIGKYLYERRHFEYAAKFAGQSVSMNYRKSSYYRRLLKSYFKSIWK